MRNRVDSKPRGRKCCIYKGEQSSKQATKPAALSKKIIVSKILLIL